MSSVDVNDENRGACPGGKHNSSITDIFALDQPTGRPSILRQTENLPSKIVPKGTKVCFQTPQRDPMTKRIFSPAKTVKMGSVEECTKAMESLNLDQINSLQIAATGQPDETKPEVSAYPDDDMPILSKGDYQLDYDNLDAINPFQGSDKMLLSPAAESLPTHQTEAQHTKVNNISEEATNIESALDDTLPFIPSVENSLADVTTDISSSESSVVIVKKVPAVEEPDSYTATPDEKQPIKVSVNVEDKESGSFVEDVPPPAKGSYTLDFDDLNAINPLQTGGSEILNSPVLGKNLSDKNPPVEEMHITKNELIDVADTLEIAQEMPVQPEEKPIAAVAPNSANTVKPSDAESMSQPSDVHTKEGPVRLEFNFEDGREVRPKPPPKFFGKRPPGLKSKAGKPASDVKPTKQTPEQLDPTGAAEVTVPKGCYSFDFDKFDDPNVNSSVKSPKCSKKSSPALTEDSIPEQTDQPVKKDAVSPPSAGEGVPAAEPNPGEEDEHKAAFGEGFRPEAAQPMESPPELCQPEQNLQTAICNDEFVPGTAFMANDFDRQIDYLEQFGSSSFKDSAWRKQSLYLKFDPLLRESPKKTAGSTARTNVPQSVPIASQLGPLQMPENKIATGPQKDDFKLFDSSLPPRPILECLVPPFPQPANTEDSIIEVLKYSQKDMDGAIARAQAQLELSFKQKEEQWRAKNLKLHDDGLEMKKLIAEFELTIAQMIADQEREREESQKKFNEVLLERDQVSSDLNAMERSCSEFFKRLEKYKDVIQGYKKNEETLKACAQDYLARIKKDEQRYQTLKAHAEEKITHANEEIAVARSKHTAEVASLKAQLRREQLRAQSLEQSFDQKAKEADELTKFCDELIAKVQKG